MTRIHRFILLALLAGGLVAAHGGQAQAQPTGFPPLRGAAGKSTLGPLTLNAGLTLIRAQNNGTGLFVVYLALPPDGESAQQCVSQSDCVQSYLVYDESSAFPSATEAVMVDRPGAWSFVVDASGAFQLTVEQPTPATVTPAAQTSFQGRGPAQVSSYFALRTDGTVTLSAQSSSQFLHVWLYRIDDLGGGPVPGGLNYYDGRIIDLTVDPTVTSAQLSLSTGIYMVAVDNLQPTDTWSATVQ